MLCHKDASDAFYPTLGHLANHQLIIHFSSHPTDIDKIRLSFYEENQNLKIMKQLDLDRHHFEYAIIPANRSSGTDLLIFALCN